VAEGGRVNDRFDSLIAKVAVLGGDRAGAVDRLARALEAFPVLGCTTNLPFLQAIARSGDFLAGRESTGWIQENLAALNAPLLPAPWMGFLESRGFREALSLALRGLGRPVSAPAARFMAQGNGGDLATGSAQQGPVFRVERDGPSSRFRLRGPAVRALFAASGGAAAGERGPGFREAQAAGKDDVPFRACRLGGSRLGLALFGEILSLEDPVADLARPLDAAPGPGEVRAPMAGVVLEVHAAPGDAVEQGQLMFVLESMKMQFEIPAPRGGRVERILVEKGQSLPGPAALAEIL
jgi:hypothetical protein